MNNRIFYTPDSSPALETAAARLCDCGWRRASLPGPEVTELLLGVPCRRSEKELVQLLSELPPQVRVFGGFLVPPALAGRQCFDLLADGAYLAQNAKITAYGAIEWAQCRMAVTWEDCPVLILGGGRIALCLARLLTGLGARVVIALRNPSRRALLDALGCETEDIRFPHYILKQFRVIFNTVPAPVLSREALAHCRKDCLKMELASSPGMEGTDILRAPGLPGACSPESSGQLIARTILRLSAGKEARV